MTVFSNERLRSLRVGISSYTENEVVLDVIGNVNISGDGGSNSISLSSDGIATIGDVTITSAGIITSSNPGVSTVVYYGDGSNLIGVSAFNVITQDLSSNPVFPTFASNVGVSSVGISSSKFVFIPSSGSVGIGTTNPTTTLHVQGTIGFGENNNIKIGGDFTGYCITSGSNNVFLGQCSGCSNTSGNYNVAIGKNAGYLNSTGSYNFFGGYYNGYHCAYELTGDSNIFIGRYSGGGTTASNNIALGCCSGVNLTSGSSNFFAGYLSGHSNTTGNYNTFFGCGAGYYNSIGSYNNFVGYTAGYHNISGCSNNFFGDNAGYYNSTGSYNNFFGRYAGFYNSTGSNNLYLGNNTGYNNSTGSYNNFFGRYAGFYNSTGSNNLYLGNNTGISTSASNKIILGRGNASNQLFDSPDTTKDTQFAIGVRTDANPSKYWIIGNENFNVGIGTTNPTSKLTVGGDVRVSGVVTATTFFGNATSATYATSSGISTYADTAGIATYASTAGIATALQNSRTFEITGDIIASPISFDGTGNVSLAATIQPNSVALGTDTTGDYVQSITGTSNQITVTGGTGESSTPTLSIPTQFTAPQDATVTRDLQVNRNLNVNGNITIGGTAATLFTTEFKVYDPDIVLGFRTDGSGNDVSTDNTANHGGIAIASTEGNPLIQIYDVGIGEINPATYKKIMWFKSGTFAGLNTDAWLINYAVGIGSTQFPSGTRLAAGAVQFTENDLAVVRDINASGIVTASSFVGNLTGTATTATNLSDAANITTGTINSARLSGTYDINVSYANTSAISTVAQGLTGIPDISVTNINASGISTLGTVEISSGIVTSTSGIVTYYGDGRNLIITNPGIGIATESGTVGTGVTLIDFRGTGISTITVSSGIATINIIDTKSDISPVMMGMIF